MSTQPDWSKAPEGATHYFPAGKSFLKVNSDGYVLYQSHGAWVLNGCEASDYLNLVQRPAAWNGEGLPPVGAACEYNASVRHEHGEELWCGVQIKYRSDWVIVFECVSAPAGHEGSVGVELFGDVSQGLEKRFRPIRTPEQIAAEERENAIEAMVGDILRNTTGIDRKEAWCCAAALYDVSYRMYDAHQLHEQRLRRLVQLHGKMADFTLEDFLLRSTEADSVKAEMAEILSHYRGPQA